MMLLRLVQAFGHSVPIAFPSVVLREVVPQDSALNVAVVVQIVTRTRVRPQEAGEAFFL